MCVCASVGNERERNCLESNFHTNLNEILSRAIGLGRFQDLIMPSHSHVFTHTLVMVAGRTVGGTKLDAMNKRKMVGKKR